MARSSLASRREFVKHGSLIAGAAAWAACGINLAADEPKKRTFSISLAEWSLHKSIFAGKIDNRDFAKVAKEEFGIEAIEYVNQFFKDKAKDQAYVAELKKRAEDLGVKTLLIMVDGEGKLGDVDPAKRTQAVENHYKWVEAAKALGCHSIRVNAASDGTREEQLELAADGLRRLSEFAATHKLNVIVENHGGLSSDGKWLSDVMKKVGLTNCGTLPDFGNFYEYDRYQGVQDLMPFAKAVSAKTYDFDGEGNETKIDYPKMMKIVLDAGYNGFVGIEYEGQRLDEFEGIKATKALLEKCRNV
jgi:sugar phosphate isomerase/epimerase